MVSVSGLRRSSLAEHVHDCFNWGVRRTDAFMDRGYGLKFLAYAGLLPFLGILCIGVSPFVLAGGRRLATDWFYFGCNFLAQYVGALAWFVLSWEAIERAIVRHKFPDHRRPYV